MLRPLLVLGIALAPAVAEAKPRKPLVTRAGRPAVGNIGQRGVPEHVRRRATPPPRRLGPPAEIRVDATTGKEVSRPLVNARRRPAVGNCKCKRGPREEEDEEERPRPIEVVHQSI